MSGTPPPFAAANPPEHIMQSMKQQLLFSSMKPLFVAVGDYHRFAPDHRRNVDQEAEAVVVKSPVPDANSGHEQAPQRPFQLHSVDENTTTPHGFCYMRHKARDSLHPKIFQSPVAAAVAASVTSAYALPKSEKLDFMQLDDINYRSSVNGHPLDDVTVKIEAIKEEKRLLELSIAEVKAENSKFRGEIDEVNSTHAELTKELQSVQGQLVGERSRCFNLENSKSCWNQCNLWKIRYKHFVNRSLLWTRKWSSLQLLRARVLVVFGDGLVRVRHENYEDNAN